MIAHSAGAIYALATALRMPQHIRGKIHLLAPWIPPSQLTVLGASAQTSLPPQTIPTSQRILRALPTTFLRAANSSFMTATSSSITSSLPKQKRTKRDRRSYAAALISPPQLPAVPAVHAPASVDQIDPADPADAQPQYPFAGTASGPDGPDDSDLGRARAAEYDTRLTQSIWALATTGAHPAVDLLVCLERRHTIGFRYVDVTRPVVIHHGTRDARVPVDNVKWLGGTMRRCEVRVLEGEGHGLMASAQVMGGVLMEVSREWDEWGRVTGQTRRDREGATAR